MPRTLCKNARSGIARDKQTEEETESWKKWICLALRPHATELGQTVAGHLCQQISLGFSFMSIQKLISLSVCVHPKTILHNTRLCWFQMELNTNSRTIGDDPYGAACWKWHLNIKQKKRRRERGDLPGETPRKADTAQTRRKLKVLYSNQQWSDSWGKKLFETICCSISASPLEQNRQTLFIWFVRSITG